MGDLIYLSTRKPKTIKSLSDQLREDMEVVLIHGNYDSKIAFRRELLDLLSLLDCDLARGRG